MIRFIACLKQRDDVNDLQFRQFFEQAPDDTTFKNLLTLFQVDEHRISLTLKVEAQQELRERMAGEQEPFDAILELIWYLPRDLLALAQSSQGEELIQQLDTFIHQVADHKRSVGFFTPYRSQSNS